MDGFKNSTKTQYFKGGEGHEAKGAAKVAKVMGEFKSGKLHSGSKHGPEVTSRKQATAIAMSEARKAGAKMPMRKGEGGAVSDQDMKMLQSAEADDALMARMTPRELAMGRAGIAAARARLSGKKAPSKAVPVASKRPLVERKTGGPVKMNNGGPVASAGATTATPRAPSALMRSLNPQKYQQAQAARAAAATPAAKAAARAKVTANVARDAALKTSMAQNAQEAAVRKQRRDAAAANIKSGFIGKQAEINAMKAANATRTAQNNQTRAANATQRAALQETIQANNVNLARQKAANDAAMAARNARIAARTPVKKAAGGRIEGSGMAADRGTAIPASREIMVTASKTPGAPSTRKVNVPVKRASGGLAAMPKGKC